MNKISISYCICVWNESAELDLLLKRLIPNLGDVDEIIIQGDQGKVTDEVISVVRTAMKNPKVKYIEFPLKKNFANFKNNAIKNCTGEYIFLIDVDEQIHPAMLRNLKWLLFENRDIDVFYIPRVNIVNGITEQYIRDQRWNLSKSKIDESDYDSKDILKDYNIKENNPIDSFLEIDLINFPDYQGRLLKNNHGIYFKNKVHEKLTGHKIETYLPFRLETDSNKLTFDWSLFHIKTFERQKFQNNYYQTI